MWMNRRRFGVFVDTPLPWLFIEIGQRQPAAMAAGEPGLDIGIIESPVAMNC
jgi:hypothetical protein